MQKINSWNDKLTKSGDGIKERHLKRKRLRMSHTNKFFLLQFVTSLTHETICALYLQKLRLEQYKSID
jgi:hypothetical protein